MTTSTILVVEDETHIQRLIKLVLEKNGYAEFGVNEAA